MNSLRKPHVRDIIFHATRRMFEWSIQFWVNFSGLVSWMDFILHILILLNCLNDLAIISLMLDHSKIRKMRFWMIQRAKKEVFGHFLEFGLLDQLDIAYCSSTKCFPIMSNVTNWWRFIHKSEKYVFERFRVPKRGSFGQFLEFSLWDRLFIAWW